MSGHRLAPTILREYDIRGIVGQTIGEDDYRAIGRAFATLMARDDLHTIAVGYDGRLHSPLLAGALVEGLVTGGREVIEVGLGPTPLLYYAAAANGLDAAIMVTGSHNPPDYNGLKIVKAGKPFFAEQIQELGRVAESGDWVAGPGTRAPRDLMEDYLLRIVGDYSGSKKLRVAWDPGNGAAGEAVSRLVGKLPGSHFVINAEIDGTFPSHHPDPTVEENLDQLKTLVAREDCDLGFAFDGDGDRVGVIDGEGRVLWGDQILCILARDVLADEPGATIITDIKASRLFFDEIERLGGKPLMWKTGHSLIKSKMAETGSPLAGEMSAHIFFRHRYYGFDDALYAALRLLSVVAQSKPSLADMRDAMPAYVNTPELRFDCPDEEKFQVIERVRDGLKGIAGITVRDIDGVRVENEDGWWLLRASNTQAVLVARCESGDEAGLDRLKARLAEVLAEQGLSAPHMT
ncbi:MAG: phosphoglucomutase/phosphomannomutase PgmG [Rhodospirillales bacterium]